MSIIRKVCCPVNDVIPKATRVNMTKTTCELICLVLKLIILKNQKRGETKKIVSFILSTYDYVTCSHYGIKRGKLENAREIGCSPEFNTHK